MSAQTYLDIDSKSMKIGEREEDSPLVYHRLWRKPDDLVQPGLVIDVERSQIVLEFF